MAGSDMQMAPMIDSQIGNNIMQRQYVVLTRNMVVNNMLLNALVDAGGLSLYSVDEVECKPTKIGKNEELMSVLRRGPPGQLNRLINALMITDQAELAEILASKTKYSLDAFLVRNLCELKYKSSL